VATYKTRFEKGRKWIFPPPNTHILFHHQYKLTPCNLYLLLYETYFFSLAVTVILDITPRNISNASKVMLLYERKKTVPVPLVEKLNGKVCIWNRRHEQNDRLSIGTSKCFSLVQVQYEIRCSIFLRAILSHNYCAFLQIKSLDVIEYSETSVNQTNVYPNSLMIPQEGFTNIANSI
jgi:hypothetical protein